MSTLNLTMLTDLYQLTMMQGYFKSHNQDIAVFDAFYRSNPCGGGYAISAGLEQVIDYIENLHFSETEISYLRGLNIFEEEFLEYLSNFHFYLILLELLSLLKAIFLNQVKKFHE